MSTSDLGAFLKARRGHVQPADVGLPAHTSRRVSGLRREEVAMLAGVSVDYYARLEQGRERNPSPSVLNAIANALCLDHDQRGHLFRLADLAPTALAPVAAAAPQALKDLLQAWPHTPAVIINRQLDVLAHNALAGALYSQFTRIDNVARMTFLDPAGAHFYSHWNRAAESCVASLRLALGHVDCADAVRRLVLELSAASAAFPVCQGELRPAARSNLS
ncbi:helix-turn-helix domain-containing protein [Kineococcus arenarius]|uniref:helix-turn-helix domain-containing protein n=1 Tax=Kineococcus sp. SYSU DK007 TaxID=3383128 RepID=UPI003D7D32D7